MATTSEGRNAVVFVASSCGGWIKVEGTQKQREKLARLYSQLEQSLYPQGCTNFSFSTSQAYSENKGVRTYHTTDNPLIQEIRDLSAEILHYPDCPWKQFPKYSRMESGAPSMQCPAEVKLRVNEADRKALQPLDDLIKRYQDVINSPEFITPIDQLKPVDRIGRKAALEKTKELFGPTRVWKDVARCAFLCTKSDMSLRPKRVAELLNLGLEKNFQLVADIIRLSCKDREEYENMTAELQMQYPKQTFVNSRYGVAAFFAQMALATTSEQQIALLKEPLFAMAFSTLHSADLQRLQDIMLSDFKEAPAAASGKS